MAGEHVGVALDHQRPPAFAIAGRARSIPYSVRRLRVQLALGRVDVLRLLVGQQRPRAEPLHPPARVADREHDPRAEAVVVALALLALQHQPRRLDLLDRVARLLAAHQHRVPGRPARSRPRTRASTSLAQPAPGQVLARLRRLRRVAQEASRRSPPCARAARSAARALARCSSARGSSCLALELDPVAVGQRLDRVGERQPLLLLDELDHVAADPAAEAVVELLLRVDRERRRALVVERAQAREARPRSAAGRCGPRSISTMSAASLTRSTLVGR